MKKHEYNSKPPRKCWGAPSDVPLSLKQNSDSDYYSDSFESYSSDEKNSDLLNETIKILDQIDENHLHLVLEYVKSLKGANKINP
jgi:hypothetical protein